MRKVQGQSNYRISWELEVRLLWIANYSLLLPTFIFNCGLLNEITLVLSFPNLYLLLIGPSDQKADLLLAQCWPCDQIGRNELGQGNC